MVTQKETDRFPATKVMEDCDLSDRIQDFSHEETQWVIGELRKAVQWAQEKKIIE